MSFRIEKHKAVLAGGFRDALCGEIARAIKDLDISRRSSRAAMIHSARRRAKKTRAAFRLLQAAAFPRPLDADHGLLRDACAEIANARSTDAHLIALTRLCKQTGSDHLRFQRAFDALGKEKRAMFRNLNAPMHRAATLLKAELARIESWDGASIPWDDVTRGMEKLYKKARTACRKAADDPTRENLHHWRKRLKDLFYNIKLIRDAAPRSGRPLTRRLKKLGSLLGRDRDLALLQEVFDAPGFKREKHALDKLIPERRRKLQENALEIGAKFFREKPADFIERLVG
jgi:hypothetical protein